MRVLAVCADAFEARPWVARCANGGLLEWGLPYTARLRWNGAELYVVANGPGPTLAERAVERAEAKVGSFEGFLSFGLCGGLDPAMGLGEVCTAVSVSDGNELYDARPAGRARSLALLSVDRFLRTPAEKAAWFARGYGAVEMEALAVARCAALRGAKFMAVKAVSDTAEAEFVMDFNEYRDESGRFSRGQIARAALRHPFRYGPDLYHMFKRGVAAAESLGAFLVQSRF